MKTLIIIALLLCFTVSAHAEYDPPAGSPTPIWDVLWNWMREQGGGGQCNGCGGSKWRTIGTRGFDEYVLPVTLPSDK